MARVFKEKQLVIATHNQGKYKEIAELFKPFVPELLSANELNLPEPVESGQTFAANAEIKAKAAVAGSGKPAIADDSGLVVPALGGAPGIYSARWADAGKDFSSAMKRVNEELGKKDRQAYFIAALVLAWPDGHVEIFHGTVKGSLVWPPKGTKGFGYDPMFLPVGYDITFGELQPGAKHKISHRADAFNKLAANCLKE